MSVDRSTPAQPIRIMQMQRELAALRQRQRLLTVAVAFLALGQLALAVWVVRLWH